MDIAVRAEGLGKQYQLSARQASYKTIRESLTAAVRRLGRRSREQRTVTRWALKDVSFEIRRGEAVGIIGRNGAGKTTLLKLLSRITAPTEGWVEICGRVGSLLEVGTGFHPELTGRENIYLSAAILGMNKAEIGRRFEEIVEFAEIEDFLDTPFKRYSTGMQLRLGFAVAAHLQPEILIVDEVLAVGDAAFQRKCLGKMEDVAKSERTILFVSHNMAAVQNLCTRVIVLDGGRVCFDGDSSRGIEHYLRLQDVVRQTSLADRTDRQGNQRLKFVGVQLLDSSLRPLSVAHSGQGVTLCLKYECDGSRPMRNVQIGIDIVGAFDHRLLNLSTTWKNGDFACVAEAGEILCHIPRLPLLPGRYSLDLFAAASGEMADYIRDAATIEVEAGDFFGSGKLPTLGYFLTEHSWSLEGSCKAAPS
jgi:lipopolysaccharide transport system ATP-binding protein